MRLCASSGNLYVTFAATGCPSGNRTQVTGGTNIERGIYRGMNELASQTGVAGERMPSVMFLTDGQPTYAVAADAEGGTAAPPWWSIPNNGAGRANVGPGSGNYAGNGFMAALTAQYFKNLVNRTYETSADLGTQTRVYTVGLGVNGMAADDAALARLTLDPAGELDSTTNTYADEFRAWFGEYRANGGTGTIDCVLVNQSRGTDVCLTDVGHPTAETGGVPAADPTTLRYNDAFYAPATAEDLEEAFAQIATSIVEAAPNYPVDVENDSPATSGYLTLTELAPDDAEGMTYDRNPAAVTVTVTDDGEGALSAAVAYDSDQDFVNMYASQYDFLLEVAKILEGRDLRAGEFTFDVVPGGPEAAQFAGIPEDGVAFANTDPAPAGEPSVIQRLAGIYVTQADADQTYCFTYSERAGGEPGMRYDDTSYEACLAIADDGRGTITVTTTITGSDGSEVVTENASADDPQGPWPRATFTNVYQGPTPPPEPTPAPTPPLPGPGPVDPGAPPAADGGLPLTGADVFGPILLGLLVVAAGAALFVLSRRSRGRDDPRL